MFDSIILRMRSALEELVKVISWHDCLRKEIFDHPGGTQKFLNKNEAENIKQIAPNKLTWRKFDHCASFSRIYAAYEQCIDELVEEYTNILPKVTPAYSDLALDIKTSHRVGVGHVLTKWNETHPFYGKISEPLIAGGLTDGLRGTQYSLLPEAFLTETENYRPETLNRIFKKIGFSDAFSFVRKSKEMIEFCSNKLLDGHTAESYLKEFIKYRNEAAHSDVTNLASEEDIKNYADFTIIITDILANLLQSNLVTLGIDSGITEQIGYVKKRFSKNIVGICAVSEGTLNLGQIIYIGKSQLTPATIISIQINSEKYEKVELFSGMEFGAKLDKKVNLESKIYTTKL